MGPPHKRLGLEETMKRGRWRTLTSVLRYEKGGDVTAGYNRLDSKTRAHCEECAGSIKGVLLKERAPVPLPT